MLSIAMVHRRPAIPAIRRLSSGPAFATTRRSTGSASLQWPCSASNRALSAVIELALAGSVLAAGARFCDCCAGRELAGDAIKTVRQQKLKPLLITREVCTRDLPTAPFSLNKRVD